MDYEKKEIGQSSSIKNVLWFLTGFVVIGFLCMFAFFVISRQGNHVQQREIDFNKEGFLAKLEEEDRMEMAKVEEKLEGKIAQLLTTMTSLSKRTGNLEIKSSAVDRAQKGLMKLLSQEKETLMAVKGQPLKLLQKHVRNELDYLKLSSDGRSIHFDPLLAGNASIAEKLDVWIDCNFIATSPANRSITTQFFFINELTPHQYVGYGYNNFLSKSYWTTTLVQEDVKFTPNFDGILWNLVLKVTTKDEQADLLFHLKTE